MLGLQPDNIASTLANFGVLSLAIAAVIAGVYQGIRKIRDETKPVYEPDKAKGIMVVDLQTILLWTESNQRVCDQIAGLRTDILHLAHQTERLRDTMT